MTNIQSVLASTKDYHDLYAIAEKAEPQISFWGKRYITVEGYKDTLPLDALTKRILEMVTENPGYPIDDPEHLEIRMGVRWCVDEIYKKSDEQVRTANCFTKFLTTIRYFRIRIANVTPLRWIWREDPDQNFLLLRHAMSSEEISSRDLATLKLFLPEPAEQSFFYRLKDDFEWFPSIL